MSARVVKLTYRYVPEFYYKRIPSHQAHIEHFRALPARGVQVLGGSTDNEFAHFNWRATHPELKSVPFPMFADVRHDLIRALGVENADGVADRATFIIDPDGVIQFVSVTPDAVGRNVDEVLRVLDALQSEEVCACNWEKNDPTKNINKMDVVQSAL